MDKLGGLGNGLKVGPQTLGLSCILEFKMIGYLYKKCNSCIQFISKIHICQKPYWKNIKRKLNLKI
ncbi:hypothetical protein Hanom_Chr17g01545791 [Helianthus anomalus]